MKHPRLFAFCLLLMLSMFAYIQTSAQEITSSSKPFTFQTMEKAIGKAKQTTYWKTIKGTKYIIYESEKSNHNFSHNNGFGVCGF
jgi:hypothetical protein